ncbi:RDD family protein [Reyranella soli]|jgi:uncharacterized RDD family membrane protein YckC|nr:RDD family protein [Reyranella soli]
MVAVDGAPPGGFWIRFVAYMIDAFVLLVPGTILIGLFIGFVVLTHESTDDEELAAPLIVAGLLTAAALIVVNWLYEALMTSSPRGATFGKMALGLRIVRADGAQLSFGRATARHFAKYMVTPMVPLAIGYIMAAFTNRKRALHDILADTLVIRSP